jgi:hypothetical protein
MNGSRLKPPTFAIPEKSLPFSNVKLDIIGGDIGQPTIRKGRLQILRGTQIGAASFWGADRQFRVVFQEEICLSSKVKLSPFRTISRTFLSLARRRCLSFLKHDPVGERPGGT